MIFPRKAPKKEKEEKKKNYQCGSCGYLTDKPKNGCRHIVRKHGYSVCLVKYGDRPGEQPQYIWPTQEDFMKYSPLYRKDRKKQQLQQNLMDNSSEDQFDKLFESLKKSLDWVDTIDKLRRVLSSSQPQYYFSSPQTIPAAGSGSNSSSSNKISMLFPSAAATKSSKVVDGLSLCCCTTCGGAAIAELKEYRDRVSDTTSYVLEESRYRHTHRILSSTATPRPPLTQKEIADAIKMLADRVREWAESYDVVILSDYVVPTEQMRSHVVWIDISDPKFAWLTNALSGHTIILNDYYLGQFLSLTRATHAIIGIRAGRVDENVVEHYFFVQLRRSKKDAGRQPAKSEDSLSLQPPATR